MADKDVQRLPAEELFQRELDTLISAETDPSPTYSGLRFLFQ